ncbi:galactokinase [Nocardioides caldifontis]|uniref:galactokinase n=1 Tax=Nocardioides caldifontis TaxID=2588938 RepID=UPI0011DFF40D|nr:galactokinase [Nocardioides caldifontis]
MVVETVMSSFSRAFGRDPESVASAPGRVNLIGEHLDYNGGRSLPIGLPVRTYVAVAPRTDGRLVLVSEQSPDRMEVAVDAPDVGGWAAYVVGVVQALGLAGTGYDVLVDGRVPLGAGLSSSAALECAAGLAVADAAGATPSREELVAAAVRAENDYVGAPTGALDQTSVVFARAGHALVVDPAGGSHRLVPWEPEGQLLVIDTRAEHSHAGGEYADRRRTCDAAAAELGVTRLATAGADAVERLLDPVVRRRVRHVVTEEVRVGQALDAVEARDWQGFGRLMTASHASLRDDYEVSCRELDVAVEAALDAGALGARMTGGGFGGSAIALVPAGLGDTVRDAVTAAFADAGLAEPGFLDGTASDGAVVEVGRS